MKTTGRKQSKANSGGVEYSMLHQKKIECLRMIAKKNPD
jgi:hypothetical protein